MTVAITPRMRRLRGQVEPAVVATGPENFRRVAARYDKLAANYAAAAHLVAIVV